jgi:hypothetical protein
VFKAIRVTVLLFILLLVAVNTWLAQARSTDWNNSLWVKIYPINGDGSQASDNYIKTLEPGDFDAIESFITREASRYGKSVHRPVRIELGRQVKDQPPEIEQTSDAQDDIDPDVRIFVRYHDPEQQFALENSVGLQKGMVGVVNAYASRRRTGSNNVIIAHEFLHTLGATDKYDPADGQPIAPDGLAEPDRRPLYPQRLAEIMGGRIALAENDAVIPKGLRFAVIGPLTASEIRLLD